MPQTMRTASSPPVRPTCIKEAYPGAGTQARPSYPAPFEKIRAFAASVEQCVVVEEVEPLLETEVKAQGIKVIGKEILPRQGELAPHVLKPAISLLGEEVVEPAKKPARPPRRCRSSRGRRRCAWPARTSASITRWRSCATSPSPATSAATLGFGHPERSMPALSMGASMGMALGLDKGRGEADKDKKIVAVIGTSTFMHMGMQGCSTSSNKGNVTRLLLDNRAVSALTGGQDNRAPVATSMANRAPRVDCRDRQGARRQGRAGCTWSTFYELPTLFQDRARETTRSLEPSVIITNQPVLVDPTTA